MIRLRVIRRALTTLYDGICSLRSYTTDDVISGSPFHFELSVVPRKESLFSARSIATTMIESGAEHMIAFVNSITEPLIPIAGLTCIRAMLEPCARAAWLLDPDVDGDTRIKVTPLPLI